MTKKRKNPEKPYRASGDTIVDSDIELATQTSETEPPLPADSQSSAPQDFKNNDTEVLKGKLDEIASIEEKIDGVVQIMQEKVRQLECLTQFSSILNSSLDTRVVRERALEATCQLIGCQTATLFLIDPEKKDLYFETVLSEAKEELKTIRLPINNKSIAGSVAHNGVAEIINDVDKDPRHNKAASKKAKFVARNMICVPINAKDKRIGVLQALNKLPSIPQRPSRHPWPEFNTDDVKLLETLGHQVAIAVENAQLYERLRGSFYDTVEALAEAIEKKDHYTGGHVKRVVYYSELIAKYMDVSESERHLIKLAALLHDVGKLGIEDKILKKEAPLDQYEWPVMKTHPDVGYQIMKKVQGMQEVIDGMRYHHERWDGKGYPEGLKGEDIPLSARIVAVADTYDAMISIRPYKNGLAPQVAYDEILRNAGTQFCPATVEAFKKAFKNEKMGKGSGGSSLKKGA